MYNNLSENSAGGNLGFLGLFFLTLELSGRISQGTSPSSHDSLGEDLLLLITGIIFLD